MVMTTIEAHMDATNAMTTNLRAVTVAVANSTNRSLQAMAVVNKNPAMATSRNLGMALAEVEVATDASKSHPTAGVKKNQATVADSKNPAMEADSKNRAMGARSKPAATAVNKNRVTALEAVAATDLAKRTPATGAGDVKRKAAMAPAEAAMERNKAVATRLSPAGTRKTTPMTTTTRNTRRNTARRTTTPRTKTAVATAVVARRTRMTMTTTSATSNSSTVRKRAMMRIAMMRRKRRSMDAEVMVDTVEVVEVMEAVKAAAMARAAGTRAARVVVTVSAEMNTPAIEFEVAWS